ncbi:SprT-like domain-containing protein [Candidatus Sulfurimonas marisnigri]|uniref:SprT-like domain-containing protein n=1 Tax=Candidatus Sulfurimonas marisnigri TaxID=2740405 RepID=A0A7S7LYK3_9BACT|nr:SprT-like domain-containing protein [Candidatus Sulfurimonas marisnigri]QOY53829.1 SprT-like domain-containing protein [Candidatus Sulfurimonas marisnigri]
MFNKKLEFTFIIVIALALSILGFNFYSDYSFKNNDISDGFKERIKHKEEEVLQHMKKNFGHVYKFQLIVTDKLQGKLYGLTSYNNGEIKIYLNKNVMQESMDYIIDSVIAHEYAHALLFKLNSHHSKDDGHSQEWKQTCLKLGGDDCQQYVDRHEIVMSKMPFK